MHDIAALNPQLHRCVQVSHWVRSKRQVRQLPAAEDLILTVKRQILARASMRVASDADLDRILQLAAGGWACSCTCALLLSLLLSALRVDSTLSALAGEDEHSWHELEGEAEAQLRLEVAEQLWNELVADTAHALEQVDALCA